MNILFLGDWLFRAFTITSCILIISKVSWLLVISGVYNYILYLDYFKSFLVIGYFEIVTITLKVYIAGSLKACDDMHIFIRNPEKVFFDGFAKKAILPAEGGQLSIWDFHQTLIASLAKGFIILNLGKDSPAKKIKVETGLATFDRNELIIILSL